MDLPPQRVLNLTDSQVYVYITPRWSKTLRDGRGAVRVVMVVVVGVADVVEVAKAMTSQ